MKFICLIFSFYVMFLSADPCCSDFDCADKTFVKKELTHKSTSKEKECPGCSPFFSCGSCLGFIVTKQIASIVPLVTDKLNEVFKTYLQPGIKEVSVAIWQPPKLG